MQSSTHFTERLTVKRMSAQTKGITASKLISKPQCLPLLFLAFLLLGSFMGKAQLYWRTDGVSATLTSASWSTTGSAPFNSPWVNSSNIIFQSNSTITNVTNTPVGNITVNNSATVTWNAAGTFSTNGAIRTVDIGGTGVLTWNAQNVSTTAGTGFIKNGTGTWDIGAQGNAYTGGFTLNAGTIIIGGNNALGTGPLTIGGGTIQSSGTRAYAFNNIFTGDFTHTGTGGATFSGPVALGAATRTITNSTTSGSRNYTGVISGSTGSGLNFAGAGLGVITVTNSGNTYTGTTSITGSEVEFNGGDQAFGAVPSSPTANSIILDGGRLTFNAAAPFTLNANRGIQVGAPAGTSISVKGSTTLLTYNGIISDKPATTGSWAKQGGNTIQLGGISTYTGATYINNGTIQLGAGSNRLPTGTTLNLGQAASANVGILDLNGFSQQVAGLNSTAGTNATASNNTVTSAIAATITMGGAGSYNYGDGTDANSGIIAGALSIAMSGAGTQILGDANTYSGSTTISNGILALGKANTLPSTTNVTLNGGTLRTNGSLAAGFSQSAGTLNLTGNSTIALGTGNHTLTFANSSSLSPWAVNTTLTITGWTGTPGASGAAGKIVVGVGGLTSQQLSKISFAGYPGTSTTILASGELVPASPPAAITINGAASATAVTFTTIYGNASAAQTFTVAGTNLSQDITAAAPVGFELSSDGTTYGTTAVFTQTGGSASGTLSVRLAASATVAGSYNSQTIVLTSNGATTATVVTAATGNTVNSKALTVSGAAAANKEYDGSNVAIITGTLNGIIGSDDVTFNGTGTFAQAAAGTGIAVTSTSTLSGAQASNYSLTQPTGLSADINKKALTITGLTANNKTFDGNTSATLSGTATLSGVISQDIGSVDLSGTPVANFAQSAIGNNIPVEVTGYSITGPASGNYILVQPTGLTANITASPTPVITSALSFSATYGTAAATYAITATNSPTSFNATGLPAGLTVNTSNGQITGTLTANPGDYNVSITASNSGGTSTPATLIYTVLQKHLDVLNAIALSKEYDRTNAGIIFADLDGIFGSDDVSLNATGTFAQVTVGTNISVTSTSTLAGADAFKYAFTQITGLTADITPKNLIVIDATAANKTYDGNTLTTITVNTVAGVISPDNVVVSGNGNFASSQVGNNISVITSLVLSGADAANYTLDQATGLTANISPAGLTLTGITAANKVYDGNTTATLNGTPVLNGVIGSDNVAASGTPAANFNNKNVGTAKPVSVTGYTLAGADAGNYTISQPTGLTANILTAPLTISASVAQNKNYDGNTNAVITGTLSGVIAPDAVTLVGTGTFASSAVATAIPVTSTSTLAGADALNYVINPQPEGLTANIIAVPDTLAKWTYEPLQGPTATPTPNVGTGSSMLVGSMTGPGTATGVNGTGCGSQVSGQNAWAIATANPGATNQSSGVQFNTSTVGHYNIRFSYDQRSSNTSANTERLQYTSNGTTWNDFTLTPGNTTFCLGSLNNGRFENSTTGDQFRRISVDLSSITSINNNASFGVRIVAAYYQATNQFRQTATPASVATAGTWRFDNVYFAADVAPSGSTAAILSGTATICNSTTTNLQVAITGGTSPYTVVYTDGTNNFTVSNYTSGANIPVSPAATTTYTLVSVTDAASGIGTGNSGSATVTVNGPYTIAVTQTANGNIAPGTGSVNCGIDATYTITPDACFSIADVLVDGVSVGAVATYTFTNVTANHTISATFTLNTFTITATSAANGTVTPAGATTVNCGANATYTITPDACYSIADVLVDGVSVGAVAIYTFTNVTANHTISATFILNTFTITATSGANGTVTPAGATTVNCGANATYTITPDACYSIADVLVDGVSVGAVATYTFTNVTANHTISATFTLNNFTITATSAANGTVTPSGTTTVNCGANATYTITPDACYSISDVLVDGASVGAVGTYTFTNVTANHTISATFILNTFTITATSGANGTVTPAAATTVNCGANATYTITPDACYSIADVLVDGVSVGAVATYTFTNVTANHTISATFTLNTFTITATSAANGTVTPAGATTVNCGANATYTITPDACYSIADVLVDGVSVGAVGTYTFTNVTANHTISATFTLNTFTITATSGANGSVTPAGATTVNCGGNATYTITPDACYSIADVLVDGVSVGALATYTFTNVTANHTISATFTLNTFTITATSAANGTVTPAGATTVNCGANAIYTITPDACYSIADVLVDGVSVGAVATYTFTNVTANHTISATFTLNTFTITATSAANGTVTPAGVTAVNCGADQTYTITPDACYSIADVLVDGTSVGAVGTYTFTNVTANHTISATFTLNTFTITATSGANGSVTPAGATTVNCGANVTYTITPDACYSIADVLVDGVSVGVVATYTFTNVTANHTISATFILNTFTITATSGANGTVTPAGATTVNCGANATYTITPDACYSIADVLVDGVSVGAVATYTFTNVTANHTISATFTLNTFTITATSGANGSVTPAGATTVNCGANATYTITPDACYSIADVLVDGVSVGAVATYTFTNVMANHTISATFSLNIFTIIATSGANGTVTPAGTTTVNCGANATYTITPDACYSIADVLVDGVSVGAVATYTFTNVTANHTISATFTLNTFTITATSAANGTVTPAGATTVNCGANATYTITPDACYSIADVLVDGVSVGAVAIYTFTNVTANHTISATFTLNTYTITVTAGANGTITPGTGSVNCGANATYTITANAGYAISSVIVDGVSQGAVGTYTFTNVTASHTISATFVAVGNNFTITSSAGANGTIAPNGATTVPSGGSQTYTITPATCYHVNDVLVDGVSVGAVSSYTFTNVTANHTISASFAINAALTAPVVSGPVNVCSYIGTGQQVTYTATSQGATGFNWVVPAPNVVIVSGQGTANLTVTFSAGFLAQGNKQLKVTALSPCGNSTQTIYYLVAQTPNTPQPIVGQTNVCAVIGTPATLTYTIPSVVGASSYNWTAQAGTTTINHPNGLGVNDTTVTISFTTGFSNSNLTVSASAGGCGASNTRSLALTRPVPSQPGLIAGPTNACPYMAPGGTAATYSVAAVAGQTYNWTVPAGAIGLTGQGTAMISFTYPATFTSGSVTVTTTNGCGTSPARSLSINKLAPATPGVIDVIQAQPCPNRVYTYSLSAMPANATSVQWTVPAGATLVSGQGSTSITVSYPGTSFNSSVTAQSFNNCGSSTVRSTAVQLPACPQGKAAEYTKAGSATTAAAAEAMKVNVYPNPTVSDFKLQVVTAGKEKINVRILDVQGRSIKSFEVMPYQTINVGADLKGETYMMEVRQGKELKVEKVIKF